MPKVFYSSNYNVTVDVNSAYPIALLQWMSILLILLQYYNGRRLFSWFKLPLILSQFYAFIHHLFSKYARNPSHPITTSRYVSTKLPEYHGSVIDFPCLGESVA